MKRSVLLAALLAACGSSQHPTPASNGVSTLGSSTHDTTHDAKIPMPTAAPVDPALAFRQHYSNPGGMWMPSQMTLPQHVENFKKMGVQLDPEKLADPTSAPLAAVVWLGGCTGSFVSPQGLIVTNHHCAQRALQVNATPSDNIVVNGFFAKTDADEKPAGPAQRVMVVQSYKDVTHDMRDGLDKIADPVARKREVDKRQNKLVADCEKDRPGIRCQVSSFFRGDLYQLITMLEIRDVRLVYVPARSVGDYGGEVDNWNWPRHTGDWSFFRAYVGKDGKPADYSTENVPYHPAHYLKVSSAGLKPADFVMVAGFPGRTERMATASEIHHDVDWYYPYLIAYLQERYDLDQKLASGGGDTAIKAGVDKQFMQNALAKYQSVLDGLKKGDLLEQKDKLDQQITAWAAQPSHEASKAALDKLEAILADERKTAREDFDRRVTFSGSRLLSTAIELTRWADERTRPDADRRPGFQQRDLPHATAGQKQLARDFDPTLDRATFRLTLVRALQLPEDQRTWLPVLLGVKKTAKIDEALIDKTLDAWYKSPALEGEKLRLSLLEKGTMARLRATHDPFVQAAQRVFPIFKAKEHEQDAREGELLLVTPMYAEAMKAVLGGAVAPDANSTLRITYGTVRSLDPQATDEASWPFTVASQLLKKNTGQSPFDAPQKELDAIRARNFGPYAAASLGGDLPLDFLSDCDITGGNSGSPTLNDKGELVGLAFDGNKEGVASDVVFDGKTTRSIHVDARYMLWTMDLLDGADRLIVEMGLTPKLQ